MIIQEFQNFTSWVINLNKVEKELWSVPISEGKWTTSEIIAHIMNWDNYLLSEIIPAVKDGMAMTFPDFNEFNQMASDYAQSGISQTSLIKETIQKRDLLTKELLNMPVEVLTRHTNANGVASCPHTGEPYSLIYIIKEFIDHDRHHQNQIIQFLEGK
ncbi:DinB family protein [Falsibacillus albus]|uniref:DinB family protein n=2 Tax=Falsibacillus albus TaxID=2478915 RepID=A0A3L7JZY7_9BACI|nr:DinB family protein [Falsibacillus albus]